MTRSFKPTVARSRIRGLSLIELMISMVLGLLVVGGAIGVFLSNQQTYRATESLARVQENARVAFELMAREVREAAGNPCAKDLPIANVLDDQTGWWSRWGQGLQGYDNGSLANTATGTDAIELMSAAAGTYTVSGSENGSGPDAEITLSTTDHDLEVGDVLLICDYSQMSIFQMTGPTATNSQVVHSANSGTLSPGNCTKGLGLPIPAGCGSGGKDANGTTKSYGPNSQLVKLQASRWFVADNGRGGNSLYRATMDKAVALPREEVAEGIDDMQLQYLMAGGIGYVNAPLVTNWANVTAVQITLSLEGNERVGTDGEALARTVTHVVALRNRAS